MTEELKRKMNEIDSLSGKELKTMTIDQFNVFAADLTGIEGKELLSHYFDRMAALNAKLPSVDFGKAHVEEINFDFNVLEVTLDRFFQDLLPEYMKQHPDLPHSIKCQVNATTDIYNDYSEKIRQTLNELLDP